MPIEAEFDVAVLVVLLDATLSGLYRKVCDLAPEADAGAEFMGGLQRHRIVLVERIAVRGGIKTA